MRKAGILLCLLLVLTGCGGGTVPQSAPDFKIKVVGGGGERWLGKTITLSELRGKAVVIHFTASWCYACKEIFNALTQNYPGVFVMGIGVLDRKANIIDFIRAHNMPAPVGYDEDGSIARNYRVNTLPLTVFIDREGKIVERVVGVIEGDALKELMDRITG